MAMLRFYNLSENTIIQISITTFQTPIGMRNLQQKDIKL
jgi:hypothetical protein